MKRPLLLAALVATVSAVLALNWYVYRPVWEARAAAESPTSLQAASEPVIVPAAEARMPHDAEVIGVTVNGRARAYALDALAGMDAHVFNDSLGGKPITVTYCDLDDFARVFTLEGATGPLAVQTAGRGKQMMCFFQGELFGQQAADGPLQDHEFVRMTWGQWREQAPGSTIYLGRRPREISPN